MIPNRLEQSLPQVVLCFSHLRWNFVYQRPQHLLTRLARVRPTHFWEEPIFGGSGAPALAVETDGTGVTVVTPVLPDGLSGEQVAAAQRDLLDRYMVQNAAGSVLAWYYTPMALAFTGHLAPALTVYDCMDELSAFLGAPPELLEREQQLFSLADVVYAGGASLFEVKRTQHSNVHLYPSSIDREHFASAREPLADPGDQSGVPHPRIGFFGVLDERLDRELLQASARMHPEWHFVLVGPVVKIRQEDLPVAPNLHYLGPKSYDELPRYIANWDVAMLPFARNASTRFISPTKTPEYLAAGRPVVSTSIHDVVRPYGDKGLVRIADEPAEFCRAVEASLAENGAERLVEVDRYLALISWDRTFQGMLQALAAAAAPNVMSASADARPAVPVTPPAMEQAAEKVGLHV